MQTDRQFADFRTRVFALVLVGASSALLAAQPQESADYTVRFREASILRATVTASVRIMDGLLVTGKGGGIDHIENGWASFVDALSVVTPDGNGIDVQRNGADGWVVANYDGPAEMTYDVRLDFTTEAWPPGNEQAGLYRDESLFVVTKPIFVAPANIGTARVRFDLPRGWSVATPWKPVAPSEFQVEGLEELTDNSFVISKEPALEFQHGDATLLLATVGLDRSSRVLVAETLSAAMDRVRELFPDTSRARYLMTLLYGGMDDGESFERSAAFTTATIPRDENRMLWGNNLAHELFHIWIGGQLRGEDGSFEWFDEGFADYYADSALRRAGLIEEQQFLRKMEKVMGRYGYYVWSSLFPKQSLAEASLNKGRFRFGVYDGGWAAAFCLDVRIRENSPGRSLDDAMRLLYARYGRTGSSFDRTGLQQVLNEVAGTDLSQFMSDHIYGKDPLPLQECLATAGLEGSFQQYAAELWLAPSLKPNPTQVRIHNEIFAERRTSDAPVEIANVLQTLDAATLDRTHSKARHQAMVSDQRHTAAPEALEQFGRLSGVWDIEQERMGEDGTWSGQLQKAYWIWTYTLDGSAVQDYWIERLADNVARGESRQVGTNLRVYDSDSATWHIIWTSNQDTGFTSYRARLVGDEIIMEGAHPGTDRKSRIVYSDFKPNSFRWRLDFRSEDEWKTVSRIQATRLNDLRPSN